MSESTIANSSSGRHLPTKSRRKLTESRREQNRRSQRVWREKQQQRRDDEIKVRVQQELEKRDTESSEKIQHSLSETDGGDDSANAHAVSIDQAAISLPEPVLPLKVALYYYIPPVPGADDHRHLWPVPDEVEHKAYTPPPGVIPCSTLLNSLESSNLPSERLSPNSLNSQRLSISRNIISSRPSCSSFPSPNLNHLQLVGESCFGATMSIAQSLSISMQAYINDHPSPFSSTSNSNVLALPVDLQPTAYQLVINHPAYLDCIPFPHFRSMAIYLSSLKRLDHCSLFLDLMHDGMVCWGREKANAQHGRGMRDGVAWSRRSWEARPWFWHKWGWIAQTSVEEIDAGSDGGVELQHTDDDVDDEDGMLSGSQWWWLLQAGDKTDAREGGDAQVSSNNAAQGQDQEEMGSFLSRHCTVNVGVRKPSEAHMLVKWS